MEQFAVHKNAASVSHDNHRTATQSQPFRRNGLAAGTTDGFTTRSLTNQKDREFRNARLESGQTHIQCNSANVRKAVGIYASKNRRIAIFSEWQGEAKGIHVGFPERPDDDPSCSLVAVLPPIYPEWLGNRRFTVFHESRFPYVIGAMAHGITTARMVVAASEHGLVGFFGAAGLRPPAIAEGIDEIASKLPPHSPWGSNLIHAPGRTDRERAVVDLYLERSVQRVSASAFMDLAPEIVRYSANGLIANQAGEVERKNHVFAKVSRPEVARKFLSPPPPDLLRELAAAGSISELQAELQSTLPVSEDITVESDSGGHTDNRPVTVLFPIISRLRDEIVTANAYDRPIRLGVAGGLGTPEAVAAAFQMGADYVLTGSVNQAAVESGLSEEGRELLAHIDFSDVTMAPAADMFELGVKVQVIKKSTMFAVKAQKLYEIYRNSESFASLTDGERRWLEKNVFLESLSQAWTRTRAYHESSNPALAEQASSDPKMQMALTFRRYLVLAAHWAREGHADRRLDYQIWCGPAMGAFNDWVRGSFLEQSENRSVGQIALNLLEGASITLRMRQLQMAGINVGDGRAALTPRPIAI